MTLIELLTSSLRTIGAKNPGVTLTADEVTDAKEILNLLLDSWSAEELPVYASTLEGLTMTIGASSRTIGTGGNFNTVRPVTINNAFVRDSGGYDYAIEIVGPGQYQGLLAKTTAGRPYYLHYVGSSPLGTIYLYPTPDAAETLYLDSLKPLTDITDLTADVGLPPGYEAALQQNLALALCNEYGRQPSQLLVAGAANTKKAIVNVNAASRQEPINLGFSGCYPGCSRTIMEG